MNTYRVLHDERAEHVVGPQVDAVIAFCEANGLDARKIPARGSFRIVGDQIRYRYKTSDTAYPAPVTEWQTVPLASPPEEHGLETVEVVAEDEIAARLERAILDYAGYKPDDSAEKIGAMATVAHSQAEMLAPIVQEIIADEVSR